MESARLFFAQRGLKCTVRQIAPPPVHFGGLVLQLRDFELRGGSGVGGRHLELKGEFVLVQVVHVPALAGPLGALLVGGDGEPFRV